MSMSAIGSFAGRIMAALFIALCMALGFGPSQWAKMLLGLESAIYGRIAFVAFGLAVLIFLVRHLFRPIDDAPSHLPPMSVSEIALYLRDQSDWGWRLYAKVNFKSFVQAMVPDEMRRAGCAGEVRYSGTLPNTAVSTEIDPTYWQFALFDDLRLWDSRNHFFTSFPSTNISVPGLQSYQFGTAARGDVTRTWPRASYLRVVFSLAYVASKRGWYWVST